MIRKLPIQIINKIAAGEAINRPVNVIKELVQNSIDAGATSIIITAIQGGLKKIQISDNGSGILKQDFPLLCQRHATSKISKISDLSSLASFGFRGQALASLSYVAGKVLVESRHITQKIGHKAFYRNERLVAQKQGDQLIRDIPKNQGTEITATNLFDTLASRKKSLIPSQEKHAILQVVSHFALHYPHIQFIFNTEKGLQFRAKGLKDIDDGQSKQNRKVESQMKIFKAITKIPFQSVTYLPKVQIEIEKINVKSKAKEQLQQNISLTNRSTFAIEGIFSKVNSDVKGKKLFLTINNRIVDNNEVFRAVQKAYSQCFRSIHQQVEKFYSYLSLTIGADQIDCNVDPKKQSVRLLNSKQICQNIKGCVEDLIKKQGAIKSISDHPRMQIKIKNPNQALTAREKISFYYSQQAQKNEKQLKMEHKVQQKYIRYKQEQNNGVKASAFIQNKFNYNPEVKGDKSSINQKFLPPFLNQQPQKYGYKKKRTDNTQISLNYFIKKNQGDSLNINQQQVNGPLNQEQEKLSKSKQKNQAFKYEVQNINYYELRLRPENKDENGKFCLISKFFRSLEYVGCFNTQLLLVQYESNLLMLNIIPYVPGFLRFWLYGHSSFNTLRLISFEKKVNAADIVQNFIQEKGLTNKVKENGYNNVEQLIQTVMRPEHRAALSQKYGIFINWQGVIEKAPTLIDTFQIRNRMQTQNISDLAYFICKVFKSPKDCFSQSSQISNQKLFFEYLAAHLESSSEQLSPFNHIYNQFFKNQMIPFIKLKVRFDNYDKNTNSKENQIEKVKKEEHEQESRQPRFNEINYQYINKVVEISATLSGLLDLKKAYHYFERC